MKSYIFPQWGKLLCSYIFLLLMMLSTNIKAQSLEGPDKFRLMLDGGIEGKQAAMLVVELPEGSAANQLLVKIDDSESSTTYYDGIFFPEKDIKLPKGQSLRKAGNIIILRIGELDLPDNPKLKASVTLSDGKGNSSKAAEAVYPKEGG